MNDLFHQVLLRWADSRRYWGPFARLRPAPTMNLGPSVVILHALGGLLVAGLPALLLLRLLWSAQWSLAGFLLPGTIGALAAGNLALMVRHAWNRRAATLRTGLAEQRPVLTPTPASPLPRFLAGVALLVTLLALATALVFGFENLRGTLALRTFEAELRARQLPVRLQDIVPPPIPAASNLVESPLLKPWLDYEGAPENTRTADGPAVVWHDPAAHDQARKRFVTEEATPSFRAFVSQEYRSRKTSAAPSSEIDRQTSGGWAHGSHVRLDLWSAYYRSLPRWPKPPAPTTPARDVLFALAGNDADRRELHAAAAARPAARFPLHYEDGPRMLIPQLAELKKCVGYLRLRAVALLADGRGDEALADTLLAFRLGDTIADEPILISLLVRLSIDNLVLQPVWEGCADGRWSDAQLAALQAALGRREHLKALNRTLHGERVMGGISYDILAGPGSYQKIAGYLDPDTDNVALRLFLSFAPRGWVRQSQVAQGRYLISVVDQVDQARSHAALASVDDRLLGGRLHESPVTFLAALLTPALGRACERVYVAEAWRRLALVGLALERSRLADGRYPANLDALVPRFLKEIPLDPMTGQALQYRLEPDGSFRLYSVGEDHRDNGGVRRTTNARGSYDSDAQADLVWR